MFCFAGIRTGKTCSHTVKRLTESILSVIFILCFKSETSNPPSRASSLLNRVEVYISDGFWLNDDKHFPTETKSTNKQRNKFNKGFSMKTTTTTTTTTTNMFERVPPYRTKLFKINRSWNKNNIITLVPRSAFFKSTMTYRCATLELTTRIPHATLSDLTFKTCLLKASQTGNPSRCQ